MTRWTSDDMPPLTGRRAIVTGANSGLGFHTALELARHGAHVTLAVRDAARGESALEAIRTELAGVPAAGAVSVGALDLASYGMRDPHTGQQVFDAKTLNCQGTYQFNSAFFLRATLRSDSFLHRMLTDYLASFTYIPGTVIFFGYGSSYEKTAWRDDRYEPSDRFLEMKRGFFFKASYLWRM